MERTHIREKAKRWAGGGIRGAAGNVTWSVLGAMLTAVGITDWFWDHVLYDQYWVSGPVPRLAVVAVGIGVIAWRVWIWTTDRRDGQSVPTDTPPEIEVDSKRPLL